MKKAIVWHQMDLRTEWNPILSAAAKECDQILPLYIYDEKVEEMGSASLWWLHQALEDLSSSYKKLGGHLCIRVGNTQEILDALIKKTEARAIYFNARFDPKAVRIQKQIAKKYPCEIFNGSHLIDPRKIAVSQDKPYRVFTPFYKACLKTLSIPKKPPTPKKIHAITSKSDPLNYPKKKWTQKLERSWIATRQEGLKKLKQFHDTSLSNYAHDRDFPKKRGTSKLSPYLHFGQLCPHEIWHLTHSTQTYTRQLFWREFSTYFLHHFPRAQKHNWAPKFDKLKWKHNNAHYRKWTKGLTGYPIVDAGMRQLWETGWMHNRLRMIVASFLTKDLFIHWRYGEKWFWDTLVDADRANNIFGWQWAAGCGADAAPYFRIFNPVLQGKRFDPSGEFVKKHVPELKNIPEKWIHNPWEAPEETLEQAGVKLGKDYPMPIVDHAAARTEALRQFKRL